MEQVGIGYSFKNIPLLDRHLYELTLLKKTESFIASMRWKTHFFVNNNQNSHQEISETYGFKTYAHLPHIKELDNFESDLIGLVKMIKI